MSGECDEKGSRLMATGWDVYGSGNVSGRDGVGKKITNWNPYISAGTSSRAPNNFMLM